MLLLILSFKLDSVLIVSFILETVFSRCFFIFFFKLQLFSLYAVFHLSLKVENVFWVFFFYLIFFIISFYYKCFLLMLFLILLFKLDSDLIITFILETVFSRCCFFIIPFVQLRYKLFLLHAVFHSFAQIRKCLHIFSSIRNAFFGYCCLSINISLKLENVL